jgi:hypothetical protein
MIVKENLKAQQFFSWIVKDVSSHFILYKCFLTYQMHDEIFMGVIHYNLLGQNLKQ